MKRHWLYYVTPFIIGAVGCLVPIAKGGGGLYGGIVVIIFVVAGLLLLGVDYFIKTLTDGRVLYVWIIEVVLLAALFYWTE